MTRLLHTVRRPFALGRLLTDAVLTRLLARRAQSHLVHGLRPMAVFAYDYIGREIAVRGRFEDDDLAVLANFLRPLSARFSAATALDIGANIGNHSLFFAAMFDHVHAFEPNPRTHAVLAANAMLVTNVTTHNVGLGAAAGQMQLAVNPLNVGEASLLGHASPGSETVEVSISVLDELAQQLGDVAFLKIDVEGFEPQVLAGARALLVAQKPVIAFEQNAAAFRNGVSETITLLRSLGYVICCLAKRDVGRGFFSTVVSTVRKFLFGTRYDVVQVDDLPPANYPMLLALMPDDLERLCARGGGGLDRRAE